MTTYECSVLDESCSGVLIRENAEFPTSVFQSKSDTLYSACWMIPVRYS